MTLRERWAIDYLIVPNSNDVYPRQQFDQHHEYYNDIKKQNVEVQTEVSETMR